MSLILSGSDGLSDIDGSASTPAIRGTDANSGVFFGVNTVSISTDGTAAVTVDSGQRTKFPTTIGVGGATPSTSGSGISFPASASASSDANTLDDYEEGTWTPVLTRDGTAPTISYTTREATYVKIGSMVYCQLLVNISSISANGSGLNQISGLPFTARADSRWGGMVSLNSALPSAEAFYVLANSTLGYFWNFAGSNPNANYVANQLYMTFVYQTA